MISPAHVIASEVRRGDRSARDTVAGAISATEAEQGALNVATFIEGEEALSRAEEIDRLVKAGRDPGPLAGVPVALKDLIDQAGRTTTCGSSFYRSTPDRSATVVDRLEAAGAVIVSRTGLHEFAYGFSSENHWFGPVRNPLDPSLSPGGSSGGSAATVAAGHVPVAIGTDTGGSVRVPAALCGVFGLKVSHGRVPLTGVFPLAASLDTVGPLAANIADLSLSYSVIAGFDPSDPWSTTHPVVSSGGSRPDLQGLRVAVPVPWIDDAPVVEEVAEGFAEAMGALQALGATVEELRDPIISTEGISNALHQVEVAQVHRRWRDGEHEYGPEVAERLDQAFDATADEYVEAQEARARLRQRLAVAFSTFDLIATPATGSVRKPIGEPTIATPAGDVFYRSVLSCFSAVVNHSLCPALVGPLTSDHIPPPALQLIAAPFTEHRLLEIGATLEESGLLARPA